MTTAVPLSRIAAAMRASNALLLDILAEMAFGDDPLDRIILIAVAEANVTALTSDPSLSHRYATLDEPPPDELRRPVSISAVAARTGMAFETIRRRIRQLAEQGLCELDVEGVRVPTRIVARVENDAALTAICGLTRTLYLRLRFNGCLGELARGNTAPFVGTFPTRTVVRQTFGHFLRMVGGLVKAAGDLTTALILLATLRENSEHTANLPSTVVSEGLMPDTLKVSASTATIAAVLELSEATVGRRLARLVREGRCLKRKGGVIVAASYVRRPEILALMEFNYTSLLRLFEPLEPLGLLAAWEADRASR
jgi:DNA-binding Lrp family transcriptional regulator